MYKDIDKKLANCRKWGKENYRRKKLKFGEALKDMRRKEKLRLRYGMTIEQFDKLKENQNGLCLGCYQDKPLCVDHCHKTGKIRGLLCRKCNAVIGLANEDINVVKNIVVYLEKSETE